MLCYPRRSLCSRMSRSKLVTQKQCCVHTSFFFLFANLCSYFVPRAIPLIPYLRADTCVYIFCNFATSNGWKPRQRHFVSNSSFLSKRKTECQKTKKKRVLHSPHKPRRAACVSLVVRFNLQAGGCSACRDACPGPATPSLTCGPLPRA